MGAPLTKGDLNKLQKLLRPHPDLLRAVEFGAPGSRVASRNPPEGPGSFSPNSQPLGSTTGAPPRTKIFQIQVNATGVQIAPPDKFNREIIITAPDVAFGIFVGIDGNPTAGGSPIPAGVPYEIDVPGFTSVWAATNAPVWIPIQVQIAPLLVGDRERRWSFSLPRF